MVWMLAFIDDTLQLQIEISGTSSSNSFAPRSKVLRYCALLISSQKHAVFLDDSSHYEKMDFSVVVRPGGCMSRY